MIGKKILALFLAGVPTALVLMAPDIHGFVARKVWTQADKRWSTKDLAHMSKTKTMAVAVTEFTSAARQSGSKKALKFNEIKQLIDATTASEIRNAIFVATTDGNRKTPKTMDNEIADFAGTVNPAATCATADTAGGHGLDACTSQCESNNSIFPAWGHRKAAACHMLCTLATAPCSTE
eukprot:jgi/Undpi1/1946/HiC_scaffold_12.g05333.m1